MSGPRSQGGKASPTVASANAAQDEGGSPDKHIGIWENRLPEVPPMRAAHFVGERIEPVQPAGRGDPRDWVEIRCVTRVHPPSLAAKVRLTIQGHPDVVLEGRMPAVVPGEGIDTFNIEVEDSPSGGLLVTTWVEYPAAPGSDDLVPGPRITQEFP